MKSFTKGIISTVATMVIVSGLAYAASTIGSVTTQIINSGDTMGPGWFQNVNDHVNGSGVDYVVVSAGDITNYHNGCVPGAPATSNLAFNCTAACGRYCARGCSPDGANCGSTGTFPGHGYKTGFVSEFSTTAVGCTCLK